MTTTTDAGLEWLSSKAFGQASDEIDTIAVGNGTTTDSATDTSMESEEYRANRSESNVSFVEGSAQGGFEAIITLKGGMEVPAGTSISEIGIIAGGTTSGGEILLIRETFPGVVIESGHTEEFTVPVDFTR